MHNSARLADVAAASEAVEGANTQHTMQLRSVEHVIRMQSRATCAFCAILTFDVDSHLVSLQVSRAAVARASEPRHGRHQIEARDSVSLTWEARRTADSPNLSEFFPSCVAICRS